MGAEMTGGARELQGSTARGWILSATRTRASLVLKLSLVRAAVLSMSRLDFRQDELVCWCAVKFCGAWAPIPP